MDKIDANHETQFVAETTMSHHELKGTVTDAVQEEHDLTLKKVFREHKAIVWWCFFWAMCAVGW
jgi:hypothetical protein